jgi:hypothetical protein
MNSSSQDGQQGPDNGDDGSHDPWGFSGYTPLSDLSQNSTLMLSAGPDTGGAFYADLSMYTYVGDDDEDEYGSDGVKETKEEDIDFRAVADQALRALENEYRTTVQTTADRLSQMEDDEPLPPIRLPREDFGPLYFPAAFDDRASILSEAEPTKSVPEIDADAVRRAIGAIQLKDPKLESNFAEWEAQQMCKTVVAPKRHSIIPKRQLTMFRKLSPDSKAVTSIRSRATTIADALQKLNLLAGQEYLQIDVLGCDNVECSSAERMKQLFGPLVSWISECGERCPKELQIYLIGPNIPVDAPRLVEIACSGRLEKAMLHCQSCVYEDRKLNDKAAQLLVSFHAGIWGYNEWHPTLKYLAKLRQNIALVVTAYTLLEAEDDAEVIQEILSKAWHVSAEDVVKSACIWEAQANAFASKENRVTASAVPGRVYRENAAWQAWSI